MSTRVVDRVENWNERSFTEGYQALADLADEEFSGVVRTNGTALFMTKGVAIGVQDGTLDDFEGAAGTIYESPSPALPVLAVMQADNEGVRDEFYSEKTSLSEVDGKLSEGGFTGYIELSENILSGDYYLVYHGGRSMSVGFVGESARLIDGDEAFETANDEVGIYQIRPANIAPLDLPDPPEPAAMAAEDGSTATDAETEQGSSSDAVEAETDDSDATDAVSEVEGRDTDEAVSLADSASEPASNPAPAESDSAAGSSSSDRSGENAQASAEEQGQTPSQSRQSTEGPSSDPSPSQHQGAQNQPPKAPSSDSPPRPTQTESRTQPADGYTAQVETQQMETHAIPSLDPSRTQKKQRESPIRTQAVRTTPQQTGSQPQQASPPQQPAQPEPTHHLDRPAHSPNVPPEEQRQDEQTGTHSGTPAHSTAATESAGEQTAAESEAQKEELEALESAKEQLDERVAELESERDTLESETEELTAELAAVRDERDELAVKVEELQSELTRLETELGAAPGAEQRITPQEALLGTDIFVRYQSKGEATLESAHEGAADRQDLNSNLRLEKHTQFETESASVGGQTYTEFLDSTVEYQFVEWLVRELLFEIRDTGHAKALADLYDVIPNIDRAEIGGVINVRLMEDGKEVTLEESFDVVLRDRMGDPLLVANLNDSREAATAGMMERLITSAERVGESVDGFSGAFLVTRSFFEPGALEIAGEATQSGFLTREKRKSFVNLSRKTGYHLCLVEARNDNFHMAVPEL